MYLKQISEQLNQQFYSKGHYESARGGSSDVGRLLFLLPIQDTPIILLASFYVFNTHYTDGCTNLFSFFEFYFFGKKEHCKKNTSKLTSYPKFFELFHLIMV